MVELTLSALGAILTAASLIAAVYYGRPSLKQFRERQSIAARFSKTRQLLKDHLFDIRRVAANYHSCDVSNSITTTIGLPDWEACLPTHLDHLDCRPETATTRPPFTA